MMMNKSRLSELQHSAIREYELSTYNSSLGSYSLILSVALGMYLPSPWRVLNGEWSNSFILSLLALSGYGVLVLAILLVLRCGKVQASEFLYQLKLRYLCNDTRTQKSVVKADPRTEIDEILNTVRLVPSSSATKSLTKETASRINRYYRSVFAPAEIETPLDGTNFLRRLEAEKRERAAAESLLSSSSGAFNAAVGIPGIQGAPGDYSFYGNASQVARVYQASPFDPYARDASELHDKADDILATSSDPQLAWRQYQEWHLDMFMHLYTRNIRRLLACHVKDVVEAFIQNITELNECGVMADLLLRRVPSQALLCPPSAPQQQLTNLSLSDMLKGLSRDPLFVSKTRPGVFLFEEHQSFEKYFIVGDANTVDVTSLERQQYVLERLILLSKDRNLDRYKWDQGASSWKGSRWSDHENDLPVDAEILMNLFCCMLDNMLPAESQRDRPFRKSYFLSKGPRRPFTSSVRSRLYLVQTVSRPPHFKVLAKGRIREIVPMEENIFHAIIVYLHALKKMKAGYLESINLHRTIEQVFNVSK